MQQFPNIKPWKCLSIFCSTDIKKSFNWSKLSWCWVKVMKVSLGSLLLLRPINIQISQFASSILPSKFHLILVFPSRNLHVHIWDSPLRRSSISPALPGSLPVGPPLFRLPILLQYARLLHVWHHLKKLLNHRGPPDAVVRRVPSYTSSSARC